MQSVSSILLMFDAYLYRSVHVEEGGHAEMPLPAVVALASKPSSIIVQGLLRQK